MLWLESVTNSPPPCTHTHTHTHIEISPAPTAYIYGQMTIHCSLQKKDIATTICIHALWETFVSYLREHFIVINMGQFIKKLNVSKHCSLGYLDILGLWCQNLIEEIQQLLDHQSLLTGYYKPPEVTLHCPQLQQSPDLHKVNWSRSAAVCWLLFLLLSVTCPGLYIWMGSDLALVQALI